VLGNQGLAAAGVGARRNLLIFNDLWLFTTRTL